MADTEKKEKPKKKKSVKKEKEAKEDGGDNLAPPGGNERKTSLTPEPKADNEDKKEKKERKKSSAIEVPGQEKSKSRKTSKVDAPPPEAKPENEGEKPEEKKPEEDDEEDDGEMPIMPSPPRVWDPDKVPFQAVLEAENIDVNAPANYYVVPPESTKKDISLLQDLDTRKLAELMEAFSMFDFDQDGVISHQDLKMTFASLDRPDIEDDEVKQMLSEGLNPLDFDAFVVLMGYKTLELDPEEVLSEALSQWDYGTEGLISEERIRHDIMTHGDKFSDEEAAAALEDAPTSLTKNKEKMIDYVKFSNDLCGLRKRMKEKAQAHQAQQEHALAQEAAQSQ